MASESVFRQETNLLALAEKIKNDLPYSCSVYNQLLLTAQGHSEWSDFYVLINSPNSHIILFVTKSQDDYGIHCLEEEVPLLLESLCNTHLIDWSNKGLCFYHVYDFLIEPMQELAKDKIGRRLSSGPCDVYMFAGDKQLCCPNEYQVKLLGNAGIRRMFDTWKFSQYSDYDRYHRIAKAGLACGVYKSTEAESKAVQPDIMQNINTASDEDIPSSWITMSSYGAMGLLMTDENHRNKGLATCVTQSAAKLIHQKGFLPHTYIEDYNDQSRRMFDKMQWNKSHRATWLFVRTE